MLTSNLAERGEENRLSASGWKAPLTTRDDMLQQALATLSTRHKMRGPIRVAAIGGDLLAIILAYALAGIVRFNDPLHEQVWTMLGVITPIYLIVALNQRAYHMGELLHVRKGVRNALAGLLITLCVVGLAVFFLKVSTDFSRAVLGTGAFISALFIPAIRFLHGWRSRRHFGVTPFNEIIIEDGVSVPPRLGMVTLNAERDALAPGIDDPAMLDRLGRCFKFADRVIVACPPERRPLWSMTLKGADVEAEVFAPELDELGVLGVAQHGGRSTIVVASGPLGLMDRFMKRVLDVMLIGAMLPFVLPLMAVVAIAIRLDSRGPIFFEQQRVGLGNRLFKLYKFRSMYCDKLDGAGHRSTGREDDRITRVGRFIRRTSIDELPQLFNVLLGDMSIVGPRPHALGSTAEDKLFWHIDFSYWHRHAVKPGMTGLAQIRGYRGATERQDDLRNRLEADLQYLSGWTIWRDLKIIAATFRVLNHRNAF